MKLDLTVIHAAIDRLDCSLTAFGCLMMDLDDDPGRDDASTVKALHWLYDVLRDEAHNIRGFVEMLGGVAVASTTEGADALPPPA
jgi:hypothetical protein